MKKLLLILATAFCLAAFGSSVSAQTTYTWNQNSFAAWTTPTNWTPTRTTPAIDDILVFNNGAFTTATDVPVQEIGQLLISGATTLALQPAAGIITLTVRGGAGSDLSLANGSTLIVRGGTTNTNTLQIFVATGATGSISGAVSFTTAQHQLDAADASGITFNSGSTFNYSVGSPAGDPFTRAGTPNAVVFAAGSTCVFNGPDIFGLALPASKVVFQTGSLYSHRGNVAPTFSGRTYANVDFQSGNVTVTGTSAVSIDNLSVALGQLNFSMTGNPGHSIKGDIVVGPAGTLSFVPTSAATINLNGTSVQSIRGGGTLNMNDADQTFVVNNPNGITLERNVDVRNGTLDFTSGNIDTGINRLSILSPATVTRTNGHVIGNLKKTFLTAGNKIFEVGTANGYSPVTVNSLNFGEFTIKASQVTHPNVNPATSLQRFWTITATVNASADLTFQYLAGDVVGNESIYKAVRISSGNATAFPSSTVNTAAHTISLAGVTSFSDWTASEDVTPTAPFGEVKGTVTKLVGGPGVSGTVIRLTGTQNRKTITDANGNYRFGNVDTSGAYTVTPSRSNFSFTPNQRFLTQLGNVTDASFTGIPAGTTINPLDTPEYFVRQHYVDFLNREPDESGFNFWSDQMLSCGSDTGCLERRRINVSAAYFLSIEFQETGGLVDSLFRVSFERRPLYSEFLPDISIIGQNVVVGQSGWEQLLETNKQAFLNAWVQRPAFINAYSGFSDNAYVDALISHTGITFTSAERDALVNSLVNQTATRAVVLRKIAEDGRFVRVKFNETFVMMEYFGYLRRDPDAGGFQFWLDKLNQFNGNFEQAEMVKAFIVSGEYRDRFPQ